MIVGISGKIGSGKDTLASMLIELQPERQWQVKKFAGKLKFIASLLTGVPIEMWEDQEFKKTYMKPEWAGMTYREFLQKLGTEGLREGLHTNVWVNALFADYRNTHEGITRPVVYPNWLITDTRFPNEAQAVRDRGGKLIRIERDNGFKSDHPSETSLDSWTDWDLVIHNNGTIDDLKRIVQNISL